MLPYIFRYIFEKIHVPWEEATFRWPEKIDLLKQHRVQSQSKSNNDGATESLLGTAKYDVVELYEYWEKGLPVNGYQGRHCYCTITGDTVTDLTSSPEKYAPPKKSKTGKKLPPKAILPYQIFTDIDVPNRVWGKSSVEFSSNIPIPNVRIH